MNIWTVYASPLDYPGQFVARRWIFHEPTGDLLVADTLEELRAMLPAGLERFERFDGDDPVIVECWL